MAIKDYYKILEVPPAATLQEIKKSFRRLAQQYHPDKNSGSHLAEARFREIKEAYEVLSNPKQREAYNYKRWHTRSSGAGFSSQPLHPQSIWHECRRLQQYVASMNLFHIPYEAVSTHIRGILTGTAIGILHEQRDIDINRQIIQTLLQCIQPLPQKYFSPVADLLMQVAGDDATAQQTIAAAVKHKKQWQQWDKYKWVVVVAITVLICWLIYWYGK